MRVLIVEDDVPLRQAISASAANWTIQVPDGADVRTISFRHIVEAGSVSEGISALSQGFDLMIVDVKLGDENGATVVEHASRVRQAPLILAVSGQATASEAFQLAALGARGYLAKPFDMRELRASIQAVFETPPDLSSGAMAQVGHRHIHAVQDEVKAAMLKRALHLESGNITRAAKRLGITRTGVQQMIDRYGLPRSRENQEAPDDE